MHKRNYDGANDGCLFFATSKPNTGAINISFVIKSDNHIMLKGEEILLIVTEIFHSNKDAKSRCS